MAEPNRRNNYQQSRHRSLDMNIQFRNDNGKIHPDLFADTAETAAKRIAQSKGTNKSTQLRRFYDELVMWEEKAQQNEEKFDEYLPFVRMLKAKAAYAEGRKLVDGAFVDMLGQMIDFVQTVNDLRVAKLFFEAFQGFYKLERPKD
ncbi:MAG: type III-A CRISPR-associated protein Csm2 [Methylohalobius crimeensis]